MTSSHHTLVNTFGILGMIISFCVYLAPIPTCQEIFKRKSTQGFQSVPYLVALFSASLWLYYALLLKPISIPLIGINSFGCLIEFVYIIFYISYATKQAKNLTVKILVSTNVGLFSLIVFLTYYLFHAHHRVKIVGWFCSAVSVSVFIAPLGIIVIRTRSVEFMPFTLSVFLTFSATIWFFYGLLRKDKFIAAPNILGFLFGILQMVLFAIYRRPNVIKKDQNLSEAVIGIVPLSTPEIHPIDIQLTDDQHDKAIKAIGD